jgi:hypothetical protein
VQKFAFVSLSPAPVKAFEGVGEISRGIQPGKPVLGLSVLQICKDVEGNEENDLSSRLILNPV